MNVVEVKRLVFLNSNKEVRTKFDGYFTFISKEKIFIS